MGLIASQVCGEWYTYLCKSMTYCVEYILLIWDIACVCAVLS